MRNPLFDALTADEIRRVASVVRSERIGGDRPGFSAVFTDEPDKYALRAGEPVTRRARAMILDRDTARTYDVVVDLEKEELAGVTEITDGSAPVLLEEFERAPELIKQDPRYVEALAKRGITDLAKVQIDPWGVGNMAGVPVDGKRMCGSVSYYREFPDDNGYAHPIEGVIAIVDLTAGRVVDVHDFGVRPMNPDLCNYTADANQPLRTDVAPLEITQPAGVGFRLDGPELSWQKWRLRIGMHPLEGLVLHAVEYQDGDDYRSVVHRASLSEMVVPYGDPSSEHFWRSAFDVGEFGLGKLANSLRLGCDCLGEIVYMDAVLAGEDGEPATIQNAICIHEEDDGILWKHTDWVTGKVDVRRSRRLVVSFIATVGNYHYGFFWYFYQDASIQMEVKLLGIVQTRAVEDGEPTPHGTPISTNLVGTYHQHLFSFRLDMEVDGWQNTVVQNDAYAVPVGPENPHGNAIGVRKTVIDRENAGDWVTSTQSSRNWTVVNRGKKNRWGMPVGYKFLPGWSSATMLAQPPSLIAQRAGFATRNMWVTPYRPGEMRSAGEYPNQSRSGDGLPRWTAADRPTEDTDVVLWHTLGVTHIPRAEDWPVMPVEKAGFHLLPVNFFDKNPALDVPASEAKHCH
ncbi:primary-amine oxidase [Paractinoplanes brasiliensis]|uniref:Amine oxidase n=1 Tax=Paractinoplanes brasiliensis TaxID=52695 RepID=A0A4R6JAQ2_9ACTN|nr:primary-amine oxidase [Actinoplanes brasiliensis]TDO32774.1 Cu2+-containing amine oxidase [Actinoplanes brasiliensis]GID31683.1 amine oxidase [Actinoplanes brasiliensis]